MGKIAKKNIWKPVDIEGVAFNGGTEGLIGIEECTDYDLNEIINKRYKNKQPQKFLPLSPSSQPIKKPKKKKSINKPKLKIDDEQKDSLSPSTSGETANDSFVKEDVPQDVDKMTTWDIVPLKRPILEALAEQKFYQPTEIQMLTLPAAILGHRDILGAAETGSGKTLAFGLPIIQGILKLKEKAIVKESTKGKHVDDDEVDFDDEELDFDDEDEVMSNDEECDDEENISDEEESDFEEREEDVDELNDNGLGCVKAINNINFDSPEPTKNAKPLYALILTPTRELAVQVKNHLVTAAKFTDIRVAVIVGGMAAVKQERVLSKGPEIVVATPGRLWELIEQGNPHLQQIDNISFLAIDETDRMVEKGHFRELYNILERVNENESKKSSRQNFVFSATLTLVHELPAHLVAKKKLKMRKNIADMTPAQKLQRIVQILGITNPKVVDITKGKGTSSTLTECRIICDIEEKDYYLYYFLLRHPGRTIIFCNSIGCVKRLTTLLGLLNCKPMPLHASMQQRQRLKNLDRFREKDDGLLVATDVAARGLDIPCIEHVIHYQTPRTSESYVHRSGRTARASKEGITILLVEPAEVPNYLRLCRTLGKTEDIPLFPVQENYLNAVKKRVDLSRELDKTELQVKKANSEAGWFEKAAKDMDMIIDDVSMKYDIQESKGFKKAADVKRKQLIAMLKKPIFPKGFSGKYPLTCNAEDIMIAQGEAPVENAISVMKTAMAQSSADEGRKRPKGVFKPRFKKSEEEVQRKHLMNLNKNKFKKNKKQFKKRK